MPSSSAPARTDLPPRSCSRARDCSVVVLEAKETIGGGARTEELTLPGFRHDVCSAIHPMALVSPFLQTLPLAEHGLEWRESPYAIAHPLDDGTRRGAGAVDRKTAARLGDDGDAYRALDGSRSRANAAELFDEILRPIRLLPRHPLLLARFGLAGLRSATLAGETISTATRRARSSAAARRTRSCRSTLPAPHRSDSSSRWPATPSAGRARKAAPSRSSTRWPATSDPSAATIRTSTPVRSMRDVPPSRAVIFDVTPRQLADIAGDELPPSYVKRLRRFRYGPGVFKVDWALDGPIPWRAEECAQSATVHVGGTIEEIAAHEAAIWQGRSDRQAVRPRRAAEPFRRHARAGRQAHRLGVLPRAARIDRGHDRARSKRRSSASRPDSATASWRGTR